MRTFAARHRLQRVSIAVTGYQLGHVHEAGSIRYGGTAHLWLGHRWFHSRDTGHLPPVLKHELAHIHRYDTRRHLILETAAVVTTVLAAGLLPLPAAVLTTLAA